MYPKPVMTWACRETHLSVSGIGCSRGGVETLISKNSRIPNMRNRIDPAIEKAVLTYFIDQPAHNQHRTSNELRKQGVFISGSGIRSI